MLAKMEISAALATATAPEFVQVYSPARLPGMKTTTPRGALELCRARKVGTVRELCGQDQARTKSVMRLHLIHLNAVCNVKKALSEPQIEFIIESIAGDWQLMGLTLIDFMVVMRRATMGEYGEMFEALSPPKVLGWLRRYAEERAAAAGELSREESEGYKGDASRSRYRKEQAAKAETEILHRAALEDYLEKHKNQ